MSFCGVLNKQKITNFADFICLWSAWNIINLFWFNKLTDEKRNRRFLEQCGNANEKNRGIQLFSSFSYFFEKDEIFIRKNIFKYFSAMLDPSVHASHVHKRKKYLKKWNKIILNNLWCLWLKNFQEISEQRHADRIDLFTWHFQPLKSGATRYG